MTYTEKYLALTEILEAKKVKFGEAQSEVLKEEDLFNQQIFDNYNKALSGLQKAQLDTRDLLNFLIKRGKKFSDQMPQ